MPGYAEMKSARKILFITDTKDLTDKLLLEVVRKQVKGFIRLGCDTQVFSFNHAVDKASPFKRKEIVRFFKSRADELLLEQIKNYVPDIVIVSFAKYLDAETINRAREAAGRVPFIGVDVDLWPQLHKGRIEAASKLDLVLTTYGENGQQFLKEAKVKCIFMPNACDPDIEYRYDVPDKWKSDIIFTGKDQHIHYPTEKVRTQIINELTSMSGCAVYGCLGRPQIFGMDYYYAISGAKTGLSINAVNDIQLYHSDRLTHYLSCGTFVLAKNVPDSDLLFKDRIHLRYFETAEEFFELADWYLKHDDERTKIANAGMEYVHREFNCQKIAGYILDCIDKGFYRAPWMP